MGAKKLTIEAVHSLIEPLKSGQERLEKRLEEVIQHLTNDRDELLKRVERKKPIFGEKSSVKRIIVQWNSS